MDEEQGKKMSISLPPYFAPCPKTFFIFAAVLFLAVSGLVTEPANAQGRVLRVASIATGAVAESQVEIRIMLDSQGDEASISFSLLYNRSGLTDPVVTRGNDVTMESDLQINNANLGQGQLGVIVNSPNRFSAGTRNLVNIRFTVPAGVSSGGFGIAFGSVPTPQSVLNSMGVSLSTTYQGGTLVVGQADGIGVSGRVFTPDGRGLRNATVIATDTFGGRRFATTSSSGNYSFSYVRLGESYTFTVESKRYRFTPRVILIDPFALPMSIDFVGLE